MRTRAPRLCAAMFAAGLAATLAGCGGDIGSDVHPGAAAVVGAHVITLDEVDDAADDVCEALEPQLKGSGQVWPMARVRAIALSSLLVDGLLSHRFAAEEDVELGHDYDVQRRSLPEQLEGQGFHGKSLDVAVEFSERNFYHQYVVAKVAARELGDSSDLTARIKRGEEIFTEWQKTVDYDVDPRLGLMNPEGSIFQPGDPGLSVAVSDQAVSAAGGETDEDYQSYVDKLPESQRCGEPAPETPALPGL